MYNMLYHYKLVGMCAIVQTVFALCYYIDPGATVFGSWSPWCIWIPAEVGASIGIGKYIQTHRVPPNTFYKIEPLTVSPLGEA